MYVLICLLICILSPVFAECGGFTTPFGFILLLFLITPVAYWIWVERMNTKAEKERAYNAVHHPLKNLSYYEASIWEELYKYHYLNDKEKEEKLLNIVRNVADDYYKDLIEKKKKHRAFLDKGYFSDNWYAQLLKEEYEEQKKSCLFYSIVDENDHFVGVWRKIPNWHVTPEKRTEMWGEEKPLYPY